MLTSLVAIITSSTLISFIILDYVIARIIQSELNNNLSSAGSIVFLLFWLDVNNSWSIIQPSHSGQTQGAARSNNKLIYPKTTKVRACIRRQTQVKDLPFSSSFTHHTQQPRLSLLASLLLHQDDEEEQQQ